MERNEGTWDKRFNVHRRRFGRLGGLGRFNECKQEWNWEKFLAYTEMHRTRSSWEVSFLM